MLKNPLLLFSVPFLFLTTLHAVPSGRGGVVDSEHFSHLPTSPSEGCAERTARNRRRSSLCPVDSRRRGSQFPAEAKLPEESEVGGAAMDDSSQHDNSFEANSSEVVDSFEAQLHSYKEAIETASKNFYSLAQKISSASPTTGHAFLATDSVLEDSFAIDPVHDSASEATKGDLTGHSFFSSSPDQSFQCETSNQKQNESLLQDLSNTKGDVVSNTYWYTAELLEKIVSLETKDPSHAAGHWADLVEKTKKLIALLEKYQSIWTEHCSSDSESLKEIASEILFYQARLGEYEAEESATGAVAAHRNYLQSLEHASSLSQLEHVNDLSHQGTELVAQSTSAPVDFHHAAETYRAISSEHLTDCPEIAALYEMMARWCEARAAEVNITAMKHLSLVHTMNLDHQSLIVKAQEDYDKVITACRELLPKFSGDQQLATEQLEITRYLDEATTRKNLLEAQLQQTKVSALISPELPSTLSEYEKFLHHEKLLSELQTLDPSIMQRGLEQAPERLKSLWDQSSQHDIPAFISSTTESLKQNIFDLMETAAAAHRATDLQQNQGGALSPTTTGHIDRLDEIMSAAKTTFEKYETALQVAKKFSNLLPQTISIETLHCERNYWNAASIKLQTDHHKNQALHWIELSKESSGKAKSALLEKASEEIKKACSHSHQLHESITRIYSDDSVSYKLVPVTQEGSLEYKNQLAAKQQEIQKALEESRKPSWASWFCSFFKLPQWFYFWRTTPIA